MSNSINCPIHKSEYLQKLYNSKEYTKLITETKELLKRYPKDPFLHNLLGACFQSLGEVQKAIESFQEAIRILPNNAELYSNIGLVYQSVDMTEDAVNAFKRAISCNKSYGDAYYNLGVLFQNRAQYKEAIICYENLLTIDPNHYKAYNNLGSIYRITGEKYKAIAFFQAAIEKKSNCYMAYNNLGVVLEEVSRHIEAVDTFYKAIAIKADYAEVYDNLSISLISLGKIKEAIEANKKAISLNNSYAKAHYNLSKLITYTSDDSHIKEMERLVDKTINKQDKIFLSFALAKAYEDIKNYEKSFFYIEQANRLHKELLHYDLAKTQKIFAHIVQLFSQKSQKYNVEQKSTEKKPIFIVGMPRSGTTLVEQILSTHSEVYGAGEQDSIPKIVNILLSQKREKNDNFLSQKDFESIKKFYLEEIERLGFQENIFIDKLPHNFIYIGFILESFPNAKIVHLNRDSMAVCWSIYKTFFPAKDLGYGTDIETLVKFYKLYEDMMQFWKAKYPDRIYDISYEKLTEDQENETRKLLEYCELEWEDACLEFHKNKRAVRTASTLQIREKIYKNSSQSWKKYEKYLKPMIVALENRNLYDLACSLRDSGDINGAIDKYMQMIAIDIEHIYSYIDISRLKKFKQSDRKIMDSMKFLFENKAKGEAKVQLGFSLGKVYEDIEEYDTSFQFFEKANRLKREMIDYSVETQKNIFSIIKTLFSSNTKSQSTCHPSKKAIFIVGMPRSGTSLVEQILSSHSQVYGAGELQTIGNLVKSILIKKYHDENYILGDYDYKTICNQYYKYIDRLEFDEPVFTDKMPHNFMSIGFILESIPDAKIVHLRREPIAVCWSMYKKYFSSRNLRYSFDMQDLVDFYKLYEDMMQFWKAKYPDRIYDISYEKLTEDQENETRKLLEYCELEWEDACLEFHKNKRVVKTASRVQVKEKMYQGSSKDWQKYEKYLKVFKEGLKSANK